MITALYAIPIALLFLALSYRVIVYRRSNKLGLGTGGDKGLEKRMRAQANCGEYAPFALLLMALVEMQNGSAWALHVIGVLLLVGRLMHGYGFSASPPVMRLRVWGMLLTLGAYLVAILCLAILAISG